MKISYRTLLELFPQYFPCLGHRGDASEQRRRIPRFWLAGKTILGRTGYVRHLIGIAGAGMLPGMTRRPRPYYPRSFLPGVPGGWVVDRFIGGLVALAVFGVVYGLVMLWRCVVG